MTNNLAHKWRPIIIATIIIAIITLAVRLFNLDPLISNLFYTPGEGFTLENNPVESFFYKSVNIAIRLSAVLVLLYTVIAFFNKKIRKHKLWVAALFISIVIGPGIIVNMIFKNNFGRPRPAQTTEFGGELQYKAVLQANWGNYGKSFPSGHASVPLSFLVLAFMAARRKKVKLAKWLTIGLVSWYLCVSLARMVAGGHYFSDIAWGGYFSFVCAWLAFLFIEKFRKDPEKE